jgi:hypothetical protein
MEYICISFADDKYYFELDNDNVALREIILHEDTSTAEISCFDDCLSEGEVDICQIEGEVLKISKDHFEKLWQKYTFQYKDEWNEICNSMIIGTLLKMKQCYIYPQGIILKQDDLTGLCEKIDDFSLNEITTVRVIGYDNLNMWLVVEKV